MSIDGQVDFRREPAPGPPKCLSVAPLFTSGVLMGPEDSSVQHHPFGVGFSAEDIQNAPPDASLAPPIETGEDESPGPERLGEIPARGACSVFSGDGFDEGVTQQTQSSSSPLFGRQ